jgi:hypothetical protein
MRRLAAVLGGLLAAVAVVAPAEAGGAVRSAAVPQLLDTTPPPAPTMDPYGATVSSSTVHAVTFAGGESEDDATVAVHVTAAGYPDVVAGSGVSNERWSVTIDLSSLPDGPLRVTPTATDPAGNAAPYAQGYVVVTKDTTGPARVATTPANGATVGGLRDVSFQWTESLGPSSPAVRVTSADGRTITAAASYDNVHGMTARLDALPDAAGNPWTLHASTNDTAGNSSGDTTSTFFVQAPGTGTDVCGTLPAAETTWSAAGAPYRICPDGVTVPLNGALDLDGSQGAFAVFATGTGGVAIDEGVVRTVDTGPDAEITLDSATGAPWAGLAAKGLSTYSESRDPTILDVSYLVVAHAVTGIGLACCGDAYVTPVAALDHVTVTDSAGDGIRTSLGVAVHITDSVIQRSGGKGISVDCERGGLRPVPVSIDGTTVAAAGGVGIELDDCVLPQLTGNDVLDSGLLTTRVSPAIAVVTLGGVGPSNAVEPFRLGATDGIRDNTGAGNGIDGIAIAGEQLGGFTWITPIQSSSEHPLGYLNLGVSVTGTGEVTVPANAVVKSGAVAGFLSVDEAFPHRGELRLDGPQLVTEPGSTFTSLDDDSVGPPTCATALSTDCTPSDASWRGLVLRAGGSLNGSTLEYGVVCIGTGMASFHASGDTPRISADSLVVRNCLQGVQADSLSLTNSSLARVGEASYLDTRVYPIAAIAVDGGATLRNDDVSDCSGVGGVVLDGGTTAYPPAPVTADIEGLRISHCNGLQLQGDDNRSYQDPVVQHVVITGAPASAVVIRADRMQIGSGKNIDDLQGGSNGADVVRFHGEVDGDITWRDPHNASDVHPLGYSSELLHVVDGTVTIPANTNADYGLLYLSGSTLDATAGGANLGVGTTSALLTDDDAAGNPSAVYVRDATWHITGVFLYDPAWVPDYPYSGLGGVFGRSQRGVVDVRSTTFTGGAVIETQGGLLRIDDSVLGQSGVDVENGDLTLTASSLSGMSVAGTGAHVVDHVVVNGRIIADSGASLTLDHTRVTGAAGSLAAVYAEQSSTISGRCDSVTKNFTGVGVDGGSSIAVTDSDLYGNDGTSGNKGYDAQSAGGHIDAERDWWGQPGGPTPDQTSGPNIDTSNPSDTQAPLATLTTSDTNTTAGGAYGPGTMTVELAFNRSMDTDIQPAVTLTGPDGVAHSIDGNWRDDRNWDGTYTLSSDSARSGDNRVDASAARGCVNDPATNVMTPAAQDVQVDVGPPPPGPVTFTSGPAAGTVSAAATSFGFTAPDATSYTCAVDGTSQSCASPLQLAGLAAGWHTLTVVAGNENGSTSATRIWSVDTTPPRIAAGPALSYRLDGRAGASYYAVDTGAGMSTYDVRYQTRTISGVRSAFHYPSTWQRTKATSVLLSAATGTTYCLEIRARDRVGNLSAWSGPRGVARPPDDMAPTADQRGTHRRDVAAYGGTVATTATYGAQLSAAHIVANHIALVVTVCPTCGKLTVYQAGHRVGTISLASRTVRHRVVLSLPVFGTRSGTLVIVAAGGAVDVDGVATEF